MANKKLIVSDGNGKYRELSSSFSVDDGILTASSVIMQTASLTSPVSAGLLQSFNGKLQTVLITSSIWQNYDDSIDSAGSFSKLDLSGTLLQYRTGLEFGNGFGPHRIASASFNGDLIGSLSASWPVKIISVANVTGGVLDSRFGGTGKNNFADKELVVLSSSGISPVGNADKTIITDANGLWNLQDKSVIEPLFRLTGTIVYLYTGSIPTVYRAVSSATTGTSNTYYWKKPAGCRFIRVICQGAGGSGTSGGANVSVGGAGGAGGAYCDVTINGNDFTNEEIPINVGNGGAPVNGSYTGTPNTVNGQSGGSSSFGNYVISYGGAGGVAGDTTNAPVGGGGVYEGGNGARGSTAVGIVGSSVSIGAAGGASGGGGASRAGNTGGTVTNFGVSGGAAGTTITTADMITRSGKVPSSGSFFNFSNYYLNTTASLSNIPFPYLIYGGGGSGAGLGTALTNEQGGFGSPFISASYVVPALASSPAWNIPFFGSGGGGGGYALSGYSAGFGGYGGAGYVLIICT